jgi:D-alanyl-D-alanine carboxypeptidase
MRDRRPAAAVVALALSLCCVACGSRGDPDRAGMTTTTSAPTTTSAIAAPAPATTAPPTTAAPDPLARPAWLGTRVLPAGPEGVVAARPTPAALDPRHLRTVDVLPPPADGRFHATVGPVPAAVAARSSWQAACPVTLADLRYVTVSFRGFDGRAHTGELLVHRDAAQPFVGVFRTLFADGYPIEEMRVTSRADLDAPVTGDGNNTSAFACRPTRGSTRWSEHAFGKAVDVNPFQNPYRNGARILPELATSYLDRADVRPGMIAAGDPVTAAFGRIGWAWGGLWHQPVDYMHFSADNR